MGAENPLRAVPDPDPHPIDRVADDWLSGLFQDHHRQVLQAAYRVTGSAADAEDVLQTVFVRLAARAPEPVPAWGAYLRRAAVNAALDVLRARRRANATGVDDLAMELRDEEPGPERTARLTELEDRLRVALALESPRPAEMFALRCFEDRDYQEIAETFGTTRAVVAVTLFRVRQRLKKELGDER